MDRTDCSQPLAVDRADDGPSRPEAPEEALSPIFAQIVEAVSSELADSLAANPKHAALLASERRLEKMRAGHARWLADLLGPEATDPAQARAVGEAHFQWGIDLRSFLGALDEMVGRLAERLEPVLPPTETAAVLRRMLRRSLAFAGDVADGYVTALREEHRALAAQLHELALHDPLTGLANRRLFSEALAAALRAARRSGNGVGLLRLDVDHFKLINDSFGHEAGDAVFVEVARRLRACLREVDTVARLGGDELGVVLSGIRSRFEVEAVAERILAAMAAPLQRGRDQIDFRVSIGGTVCGAECCTEQELLRAADDALYEAKRSGRARFVFVALSSQREKRPAILPAFVRALDGHGLRLHWQPQLDIATGQVVGLEALLRFEDPELKEHRPDSILAVIERSPFVHRFAEWCIRSVGENVAELHERIGWAGRVALNLSRRQLFWDELASRLGELAERLRATGSQIEIEISEEALDDGTTDRLQPVLSALRAAGVRVALDDFGTGYASLAHLRQLQVDVIKVDRRFVVEMSRSPVSRGIVKSIIGLARDLRATVVAEGVETLEQARTLRRLGCDAAQGYLWTPALPTEALANWLASYAGEPVDLVGCRPAADPQKKGEPAPGASALAVSRPGSVQLAHLAWRRV
ncbi:MAG: EAL domain-containing protein [Geminicoccaceae bacterium]|nr:EAL domain-containing protein [Geminicoccaceae bacterium]